MLQLVQPSKKYKESFLQGLEEFQAEGNELSYNLRQIKNDFEAFIQTFAENSVRDVPRNKRVPDSLFWLVDGEKFIGRISIRHCLNERLEELGGHIGYYIRPSERGKGYGKKALALALTEAKKLNINKVLITCDEDNIASQKVIMANGGVLQDVIETRLNPGKRTMRWWIQL